MFNIANNNKEELNDEIRGVFISYIEFLEYFQGKNDKEIKTEIEKMIKESDNKYINTIYLHVRPFSDSIYNSKVFPFTHTISGTQGENIGFDVLKCFIEKAHKKNIKIYAWINPYRVSNSTNIELISESNPAYKWLGTNHVKVIEEKGIYYNPASSEVKKLIISGVEEIIENYEVDGILFDDYFYPDEEIDLENYKEVENSISLNVFRLSQVNELISSIYKKIKEIKPDVLFGISPDGNISNNYESHYADIKTWLKEEGYIDYIMPQIYYGFLHETKPFIETINEWYDLIRNNVKLIPVLSLYKSGNFDSYAGNGIKEWIENDDIIKKQILVARNISNYHGFSIFRYENLVKNSKSVNLHNEIKNYSSLFIR